MASDMTPSDTVPIGRRIQNHLDQLEKKPSWLAEKAGVERSTVSRIIRGDRNPTAQTLSEFAPVLGVGLGELVVGTDAAVRVDDAAKLVSRSHYEAAVQQVVTSERKANDLELQVGQLRQALEQEQAHRANVDAELRFAQRSREEAVREAARHRRAAARNQRALEKAVTHVGQLQTQVKELGNAVDDSRSTGHVAAILAGTAAVASIATYLATDPSDPADDETQ